jgi:hypothetical protein
MPGRLKEGEIWASPSFADIDVAAGTAATKTVIVNAVHRNFVLKSSRSGAHCRFGKMSW